MANHTVHGVMSSYFGDYEFDLGKSVRWFQYFCNTEFCYDTNTGEKSRNYMIAWDKSFPNVGFAYNTNFQFFSSPANAAQWRQESFEKADAKWNYGNDDWVMFVDCSEGLCVDDTVDVGFVPPNPQEGDPASPLPPPNSLDLINPFKSYVEYEIDAALAVDPDCHTIFLPVWAFLDDTGPYAVETTVYPDLEQNLIDGVVVPPSDLSEAELLRLNTATVTTSQTRYAFAGYCPRLFKASRLRDPGFDWTTLDDFDSTPSIPEEQDPKEVLSIISYAYARWAEDSVDRNWDQSPVSEAVDKGFAMRTLISQIRPITGFSLDWNVADTPSDVYYGYQPPELIFPNAVNDTTQVGPEFAGADSGQDNQFGVAFLSSERTVISDGGNADVPAILGPKLRTPLYQRLFRDNPRDGLVYQKEELGPVPWNELTSTPAVSPQEWADQLESKDVRIALYDRGY